jgi:hypothetical protein
MCGGDTMLRVAFKLSLIFVDIVTLYFLNMFLSNNYSKTKI